MVIFYRRKISSSARFNSSVHRKPGSPVRTVSGYPSSIQLLSLQKSGWWYGVISTVLGSSEWEDSGSENSIRSDIESEMLWLISKSGIASGCFCLLLYSVVVISSPKALKYLMVPCAHGSTDKGCEFSVAHVWLKLISRYRSDQRLQLVTLNNSSILEMRDTI